jgi:hypothetical protein
MVEYRPPRAMVVYHWVLAIVMLLAAAGLAFEAVRRSWPSLRETLPRIGLLGAFAVGVWFLIERACFVTFTRLRCTDHELLLSAPGRGEIAIPYHEIEAAHAFSMDAWPFGRLRLVRLLVRGRGVTLPLAKHPAEDEVFACIADRARLVPTDAEWRNDLSYGRSDWIREAGAEQVIAALRRVRRRAQVKAIAYALSFYGLLVLWAVGIGDAWIVWVLAGAIALLGLALWVDGRGDRTIAR